MSTSLVENAQWQVDFALGTFDWDEWVRQLADVFPMPVYDLPRILDTAAAWDIVYHARHWPAARAIEVGHVRMPPALGCMLSCVGITYLHQQQYAAKAMYRHCAQYTAGTMVVGAVPTDHMDHLPVVPARMLRAICAAARLSEDSRHLACWLENVIVYGSSRQTKVHSVHLPAKQMAGRRRRRTRGTSVDLDEMQSSVNRLLAEITDIAPSHLPHMWCTVTTSSTTRAAIVLYARQHAPSDV